MKAYEIPELKVLAIEAADVVATSVSSGEASTPDESLGDDFVPALD